MRNRGEYLKLGFLFLLSMVPVFWFISHPGKLIDGVDTNFPLNPSIWFLRRFFVWTAVANAGTDFSASTAGTFFHFLQFVPFKFGFSLQFVELFSLLFWFSLIVFSSWFLARIILPRKHIPQLIFVVLYSLNIWLFNSWENVKVANLSLAASIPIGFSLLLLLREGKIMMRTAALGSVLTGIVLAGAGINPAYIICFFLIISIFFVSEVIVDSGNWDLVIERLKDFLLVGILVSLVNAFWILPSFNYIFGSITPGNSIGVIGFTNWVDSLSTNTSFINVLRMQGAWDWYSFDSVTRLPVYIPYALRYFYSPFFIGFSFLVPGLAFLAYFFSRLKHNLLYISFGMMLLVGAFLTEGTHIPTGILFSFFVRHIPFFSLFRSPWYIFAPLIGISIAGLVAIFFDNIRDILPKIIVSVFGTVFIIGTLFYSYPLLLGRVFRPATANGFFIRFPDYVFQVRDYLSKTKIEGRILSYPDDNIENFNWGYTGIDSILNLFSDKEVIFSPLNDVSSPVSAIVSELYQSLKKGQLSIAVNLAKKLNISEVFYKEDQNSLSPVLPKQVLDSKVASFDKWGFYRLTEVTLPKISVVECCVLNHPHNVAVQSLSLVGINQVLVNPDDGLLKIGDLVDRSTNIVNAVNSQVADFKSFNISIKSKLMIRDLSKVDFDFDMPRSGSYSPVLERYGIDQFGILNNDKLNVLIDGKTVTLSVESSDDSYLYFVPINLLSGMHKLEIKLVAKNLITDSSFVKDGNGVFSYSNGVFSGLNLSDSDVGIDFPVSNFDPYSHYLVGVTYQQIYGNKADLLIVQNKGKVLFKSQSESMPNYPGWRNFSFYYSPVESASQLSIHLVAPQTKDPLGTNVQYKNFGVYKVFDNNLFFAEKSQKKWKLADINFIQNSPVLYSGQIKNSDGPQVILFDENYSPNWELSVSGNAPAKIFHFTGNNYANAWYVSGLVGNYTFKIYYKPQNLLKLGYIIAGTTFFMAIVYFVYDIRKRKNGK